MRPKTQQIIAMIGLGIGFIGFCTPLVIIFSSNVWIAVMIALAGVLVFGSFIFIRFRRGIIEKKLKKAVSGLKER